MIDTHFWEQEPLNCTDAREKRKKGGIVLVARSAAQVKGERGRGGEGEKQVRGA